MYQEEVDKEITPGVVERLKSGDSAGVRIIGCTPDLSPLLAVADKIIAISVEGVGKVDWGPSEEFKNLQFFSASETDLARVPFSAYRRLTAVEIGSRSALPTSVGSCRALRFLRVMRPKWDSLECLQGLTKLTSLTIDGAQHVESLAVGWPMPSLRELYLFGLKNLQTLEDIQMFPGLRALRIAGSPRASRFDLLQKLPHLKELALQGCVLESLGFLRGCSKLDYLWLASDVRDGDMTPLIENTRIRKLYYTRRKHYTHTLKEVAAARGVPVNELPDMHIGVRYSDRKPLLRLESRLGIRY